MKYVVTAISRLTGERVIISAPHSEWKARLLLEREKARRTRTSAYSRLKVEPAEREGRLCFSQ